MARYKIWDKQETVFTPVGEALSAAQWTARYPWANIPGVKMIISNGVINGGVAMEFEAAKAHYLAAGATITEGMSDLEVLAAIEAFEDNPPANLTPTAEERSAAALEFIAMANLPDAGV
jgi:hypothetical protein